MRIAVNTRLLLNGRLDGIGWYTYETFRRITRDHPEHKFIFLFDRPYDPAFIFSPNVRAVAAGPPTRHVFLFPAWFELTVPRLLKKHKADLFVSPDGHLSLRSPVPSLAVIHDLNFHHHPEQLPPLVRRYYTAFFPKFARKARRIATVSEYSRNDIVNSYGIDPGKIDVTGNGYSEQYRPHTPAEQEAIRRRYTNGALFFLFVGSMIPRKNLVRLMLAFERFKRQTHSEMRLVLAGNKKWWDAAHQHTLEQLSCKSDIVFTGYLPPDELAALMASALALTYVPIFEGFGIPILEAFASGTPVLTSTITSMPEVAGDAALLTDPFDVEAIAAAMEQIANDPVLRNNLIQKGTERKTAFSWDRTAASLWKSIEACCRIGS